MKAIVEVKPYLRSLKARRNSHAGKRSNGSMDFELFTGSTGNAKERRERVSQDMHEIYLTIAEFDLRYVDCVCGKENDPRLFLRMQECGPFYTDDAAVMKALGCVLIGFDIGESLKTSSK
ncbi:hypothetical protein GGR50DRAFT_693473 [Xylaria sp. CBS 124048]|nr:hypothetical protein GGR50DRAFT_693473 [Xylaria sp. CBS 124048]